MHGVSRWAEPVEHTERMRGWEGPGHARLCYQSAHVCTRACAQRCRAAHAGEHTMHTYSARKCKEGSSFAKCVRESIVDNCVLGVCVHTWTYRSVRSSEHERK